MTDEAGYRGIRELSVRVKGLKMRKTRGKWRKETRFDVKEEVGESV